MKINFTNKYVVKLSLFLVLTYVFSSCKKETDNDSINGNKAELVFTLSGMEETGTINGKQALSTIFNSNNPQIESKALSTTKIGNIDLMTYASEESIAVSFDNKISPINVNDLKLNKKLAANIPMEDGIKYMILVYNNTTNARVAVSMGTAGQAIKIPVPRNGTYKWIAYSYNKTDDIIAPQHTAQQTIPTPTDSDLLYTNGTVTVGGGPADHNISILFKHKLSLIQIELDYDRMFAKMEEFDLKLDDPSILNKGTFDLFTGNTSNITPYTITSLNDHLVDHPDGEKIKVAKFYVANPAAVATSFDVTINKLTVKYASATPATAQPTELIGPGTARPTVTFDFGPFTPTLGKKFIAKIKMWYNFKPRTILHVTRYEAEDYGYSAAPYYNNLAINRASFNMLNTKTNYGLLPNSVVRAGAFTHIRCSTNGTLHTFLTATNKPDIVIISVYYRMMNNDQVALKNYINAGGVVLLMTDGINTADRDAQEPFFQDFFGNNSITLQNNGFNRGSLYEFLNIKDEILNGPFGDLRPNVDGPKYWGEDASATTTLANIPSEQITYYSSATAANKTGAANGVTMFKHNYKNFFWIGDGGFLSNALASGIYVPADRGICPFATDATTNFPIPKNYGEGTLTGWIGTAGRRPAQNSILFANVMSWAIVNAEFFGINTGGLPADPNDYVIF